MPLLFAFFILLLFQLAGEFLMQLFAIPLPGPLAGMLLLLLVLILRKGIPPALNAASNWLISHLMLLFIPAVAGVMLSFNALKSEWLPFAAGMVIATFITQFVTAYCLNRFFKRRKRHDSN